MYLFLSALLLLSYRSEILTERIHVLSQLNASTEVSNKLVSQRFTDNLPQVPLLGAADDFILPANISANISIFQLSFSIVRIFRDTDPDSITVALMYNDPLTEGPGAVFFTKTVRAPNNPPRWHNDSLGVPEIISLNITQDEGSANDPFVYFDIHNETFLPRQTRLWLRVYVTGMRSYDLAEPHAENVVFWCITSEKVNQTWQETALSNAPYFFRDDADYMEEGLVNWTNASVLEPLLGINAKSRNMAWSLDLIGVAPSNFLEMIQGLSPKQLVSVIVCIIIGSAFLCGCIMCICKRCKRCKRRTGSLPLYDLGMGTPSTTTYKPVSGIELDETNSEVSLESTANTTTATTSTTTTMASNSLKSSPSGKFLQTATQVPVKTRNTKALLQKDEFDKDK